LISASRSNFTNNKAEKIMSSPLKKRYLFASASAVAAAFISVNLYPEQHGLASISLLTRIVLSTVIIALFVYILIKVYSTATDNENENRELINADIQRQKKMFLIWSAFTILLTVPLVRIPVQKVINGNNNFSLKEMFSISSGIALTIYTVINVIKHYKDKQNKTVI
jgi:heme/copper-type cytochrome/quinol oxidase subunit 2